MRQELLKTLTTEDIQEILDSGQLLWENREEPTAENILRHILEENGCPPSIGYRFPFILSCAELAVGRALTRERCKENTIIRAFVAYRLRTEGYTYKEIGEMLNRDHSSVVHLNAIVRNMLSVPEAYKDEVPMFQEFERNVGPCD